MRICSKFKNSLFCSKNSSGVFFNQQICTTQQLVFHSNAMLVLLLKRIFSPSIFPLEAGAFLPISAMPIDKTIQWCYDIDNNIAGRSVDTPDWATLRQGAIIKDCYYVEDLVNGMRIACFREVDSASTSVFYEVERVTHWTPFPNIMK